MQLATSFLTFFGNRIASDRELVVLGELFGTQAESGYEIVFAPLADQRLAQKHRYPSELTSEEIGEAVGCDEIFIPRLHEESRDDLLLALLARGRQPVQPVWRSYDCMHARCNYRERSFCFFQRIMDESLKNKYLVPKGTDLTARNPEDFEVI